MSFTPKRSMPVTVMQQNKAHRGQGNSVSLRKKEAARNKKLGITPPAAFNIKANTSKNVMSRLKHVKKLMDREHRKHFSIVSKRVTDECNEPPILVAVVGPPGVGKSLLIKSLIKHYTTTKITDSRGPMTILANRNRRITFFECPNELNAMIDLAKICDLALLLVDASYGFEMETFEFLNCAQIHGFPRILGVMTKLDTYTKLKKKQSIVYHVKHRFWKEIYAGAKLFILKGLDPKSGNNYYYLSDIRNLVKLISLLKFRPLLWRNTHPYLLIDRYEDITEPSLVQKDNNIDRSIAFYGYTRGCNLRSNMNVHICGVGDYVINNIEEMEDPVPLPKDRMRHLVKNGKIYAPMANLGPVVFDKHAAYIVLKKKSKDDDNKQSYETDEGYVKRLKNLSLRREDGKLIDRKTGIGKNLVDELSKVKKSIDENLHESGLQLFGNSKPISMKDLSLNNNINDEIDVNYDDNDDKDDNDDNDDDYDDNDNDNDNKDHNNNNDNKYVKSELDPITGRTRRKVMFYDEAEDKLDENIYGLNTADNGGNDDGDEDEGFDFNAIGEDENVIDNEIDDEIDDDNDNDNDLDKVNDWLLSGDEEAVEKPENKNTEKINEDQINDNLKHKDEMNQDINMIDESNEINKEKNQNIWNENWLNSDIEKERQKKEKLEIKKKNLKNNVLNPLKSTNVEDSNAKWKQNLLANASDIWKQKLTVHEWVYGEQEKVNKIKQDEEEREDLENNDDDFFKIKQPHKISNELDMDDSSVIAYNNIQLSDWNDDNISKSIRNRFVTGDWVAAKTHEAQIQKRAHDMNPELFDERVQNDRKIIEEFGGETEDIPENMVNENQLDWEYRLEQSMKSKGLDTSDNMEDKIKFAQSNVISSDNNNNAENDEELYRIQEKIKKKQEFDLAYDAGRFEENAYDQTNKYETEQKGVLKIKSNVKAKLDKKGNKRGQGGDNEQNERKNLGAGGGGHGEYYMDLIRQEIEKQNEINKSEFVNEPDHIKNELRGYLPGSYVRITIHNIPSEFDKHFDLEYPLILGGLLPQELQFGYIQCRIKKHRWYGRLLRYNDPLIMSVGWRRFQTLPLYCMEDRNSNRLRMIKYTPEHMHCLAVFYGPISPPNIGFLGYVSSGNNQHGFRISATGTILSNNSSYKIVKKLKLIGEPYEIHRNTVFVKGMFNSNLEVSKFISGKLQTVSGIRGSIKKPEGEGGNFRATFEDRLLKSDIIFLKSWIPITPIQFYNPVYNLLYKHKSIWKGMKTVGELRYNSKNAKKPVFKKDSLYTTNDKNLKRKHVRNFNPLIIPKTVDKALPFHLKPKFHEDNRTKQEKYLESLNYKTKKEKDISKMVSNISNIVANHQERIKEGKKKKKLRIKKMVKNKIKTSNKNKRERIKRAITKPYTGGKFESVRGNKFHKEWRLSKKKL